MELAVLQMVARELNDALSTGFVNKIHQPLPREIVLRIRTRGEGEKKLMLSADPQLGRIHLTDFRIPNPPSPPRFCAFLRAHLQGGIITGVSCEADDRVVKIMTTRGSGPDAARRVLILELLGRDSNIILVDRGTSLIMDCLHRIPDKETTTRIVAALVPYEPPPKRGAGPTGAFPSSSALVPGITTLPNGNRKLTVTAAADDEIYPSMNSAVNALFRPRLEGMLLEGLRREIARPVKAAIKAVERRVEKIHADLKRIADLAARGEEGELLKANLSRMRRGMTEIEVAHWTSGEMRLVSLEPALDPVANMERKFKAAAKGKRGRGIAQERLRRTVEEKAHLEDLLFFIDTARDADELERLAEERPAAREVTGSKRGPTTVRHGPAASLYHTFRSPGGFTVLVGKSGKGNDRLLRTLSHEGDLWFHVKDRPGTHVLLLRREPKDAGDEDKAFAAGLAVHFSRARGKGKVEVIVTDAKNVARPKGAPPGQVTVRTYSTVLAEAVDPSEQVISEG